MYERAEGELQFARFDIKDELARLNVLDLTAAAAVESYLTSTRVMAHIGLGDTLLSFTLEGVAIIEASMDEPKERHGPFPPMNVVIGDIGQGAQVAFGSGLFTQSQDVSLKPAALRELVCLVQAAVKEWPTEHQRRVAGAQVAIEAETESVEPDPGLLKASFARVAKIAETVAGGTATQALISYLKASGWLP
jgi:hypothetical protein